MTVGHRLRPFRGRATAVLAAVAAGTAGLAAGDGAVAAAERSDAAHGYVVKVIVGGDRSCTGVLLDPYLVATAKECFEVAGAPVTGPPPAVSTVVTRADQPTAVQTVAIDYLHVRDDRNLAVAHLTTAVTGVLGRAEVSASPPVAGETLRVLGFGRTADEWVPALPHTGQISVEEVSSPVIDVLPAGDGTICKGDAGGPVVRENSDGTAGLVAVLSASGQGGCLGETSTRRDATATRVDGLADWIDQFREFELTGVVEAGTGDGCLMLTSDAVTYQLAGGDGVVKPGETVHVVGYRAPNPAGSCGPGVRFQVRQAHPVGNLVGTVTAGAENCLVLTSGDVTYHLVGGDPAVVGAGAKVTVAGYATSGAGDCAQGTPFRVLSAVPATLVSLRSHANGRYVTAEDGGASALIANRDSIAGSWEVFDAFDLGGGNVALRATVNDRYVTAEHAGASPLIANRDAVDEWETFQLIRNADGSVSLKAKANGRYVTAESAGASALIANRDAVDEWEKFDWITG